jgi:hypothetical protein
LSESLFTAAALKWLYPGMCANVALKIERIVKTFAAELTMVAFVE